MLGLRLSPVASSNEFGSEGATSPSIAKRKLILRDSLTFLSLTLLTCALFAMTLILFRSFAAHRSELGTRWSGRGRSALIAGRPEQAIASLRTALSYAPGDRAYELLLAQALAQAGHTEEAYNYYSGLWDSQPGDGFLNLHLARLAAGRKDRREAVNFYRASLYGTWEGDGVARRRDVRLELVRYLLQNHDISAARAELLVAEGNADNDPAVDLELGRLFQQAGDRRDALDVYLKAIEVSPKDPEPLRSAGALAYSMGEFATAQRLLHQAARMSDHPGEHAVPTDFGTTNLLDRADRILDLLPSSKLPSAQRVTRLLALKSLAKRRLDACAAMPGGLPTQLSEIRASWLANGRSTTRAALLKDQTIQDDLLDLIYKTEAQTDGPCGPAAGDDALLVLISRNSKGAER